MAHEAGRSVTPVSGRSTPVPRSRHNVDESVDLKDKSYRRYAAGIERALSSFETTQQEWADYISFLGRLLKALQARPPDIKVVPDSWTIALRLAQCLNPGLPSGVHQKALELYGYVFSILPTETLSKELQIYLPGLSSVLSFASLSVRPYFLAIFNNFIVPLDFPTIRPALKAIILSLLPGLEDETSEDFDRVLETLDKFRIRTAVESKSTAHEIDLESQYSFFWQCFFLATITSTSRRQGALAYLSRKLPKFGPQASHENQQNAVELSTEAQAALSPEPGLLVRSLAVGLSDKQSLVQRGFLDLLVTHLPLRSTVLQDSVPIADLRRLVAAAAGVVSRRDMSLNRRLWSWLLGPEPSTDYDAGAKSPVQGSKSPVLDKATQHVAYFGRYGLQALSYSILEMITNQDATTVAERSRPFRICLSLMDRWEVGGLLIPDIFVPAMESAYTYSRSASKQHGDELIRSASIFFDGIESGLIWTKFLELVTDSIMDTSISEEDRSHKLKLCDFIVQNFNLREEEMLLVHIPLVLLALLVMIKSARAEDSMQSEPLMLAFGIIEKLSHLIPDRAFADQSKDAKLSNGTTPEVDDNSNLLQRVQSFYGDNQGSLESKAMPIRPPKLGILMFAQASAIFKAYVDSKSPPEIDHSTKIFVTLITKFNSISASSEATDLVEYLMELIEQSSSPSEQNFALSSAVTAILVALQSKESDPKALSSHQTTKFQRILVGRLWPYLSPSDPKFHVEAVRCFGYLDSLSDHRGVEASTASLIRASSNATDQEPGCSAIEAGQRYGILWTHLAQDKSFSADKSQKAQLRRGSGPYGLMATAPTFGDPSIILKRPLLILLESLADPGSDLSVFTQAWLQELPGLARVFQLLIEGASSLHTFRTPKDSRSLRAKHSSDTLELVYYLKLMLGIIQLASEHIWLTLAGETAPAFVTENEDGPNEVVLQTLIAQMVSLCLISTLSATLLVILLGIIRTLRACSKFRELLHLFEFLADIFLVSVLSRHSISRIQRADRQQRGTALCLHGYHTSSGRQSLFGAIEGIGAGSGPSGQASQEYRIHRSFAASFASRNDLCCAKA